MSRENVEIVRQAIEANRSDDLEARIEAVLALWDPSCEYTRVTAAVDPQTYRGHNGIRRYISDMADSWAEWRSEAEDVFEVVPDTVFATFRFRAIGKDSGVPVEARLGVVFVLSDGKLLRGHTYPSREQALEAAGLSE
jgi:ketosteroid isomerase-like protein